MNAAGKRKQAKKQLNARALPKEIELPTLPKPKRKYNRKIPLADQEMIRKDQPIVVRKARRLSTSAAPISELEQTIASSTMDSEIAEALYNYEYENFRLRFMIPNIGQEKAILPLKTISIQENNVVVGAFTGGNFVGKTTALAILFGGMMLGTEHMNPFFDGWNVFEKFRLIREEDKRPIVIRIVCHRNNMMEDGAVYQKINEIFPKGWIIWSKNQMAYYSSAEVRDPNKPERLIGRVQVRTHDQEKIAHAGDTVDAILCDEPMPQHLFSENVSRLRGSRGGVLWFFCTPLDIGGWMKDDIQDDHKAFFTSAPIWDNCSDYHPDPDMWSGGKVGVGQLLNRGRIPKSMMDDQIHQWRKEGPEAALARETGKFTHLSGAILKEFDQSVHVIQPFTIPRHWPIYCVMDPHFGGKPSFVAWFAHEELTDKLYLVAEHPGVKWDQSNSITESVPQGARAIREIEIPFQNQVVYRFCDPALNKHRDNSREESRPFGSLWRDEGFNFRDANNDPNIGLSRLRELLFFDKMKPFDEVTNCPRLRMFSANPWTGKPLENVATSFTNWTWKKGTETRDSSVSFTSSVTQAWKDPVDCCRYLAVELRPWKRVEQKSAKRIVMKQRVIRNPRAIS